MTSLSYFKYANSFQLSAICKTVKTCNDNIVGDEVLTTCNNRRMCVYSNPSCNIAIILDVDSYSMI